MLKMLCLIPLFISKSYALVSPSDLTLIQIATNTLNSARELNEIVTESREFGENFERVYSEVDQKVWKIDRTTMWLEDMKALGNVEVESLDDFNYVLRNLKSETGYLRKKLVEKYKAQQISDKREIRAKSEEKRSKMRVSKYSSEAKGSMSPTFAQVETAKNTRDQLVEIARLNAKVDGLTQEISRLTKHFNEVEQRRIKKELLAKKSNKQLDKGVLRNEDVRVKR